MVAPNGARRTKADHAKLPITPAEIADEAARCARGGRERPARARALRRRPPFARCWSAIGAAIGAVRQRLGERIVIQVTTEAVGRYGPAEQMAMVRELHPEAVSLALAELIPDEGATARQPRSSLG